MTYSNFQFSVPFSPYHSFALHLSTTTFLSFLFCSLPLPSSNLPSATSLLIFVPSLPSQNCLPFFCFSSPLPFHPPPAFHLSSFPLHLNLPSLFPLHIFPLCLSSLSFLSSQPHSPSESHGKAPNWPGHCMYTNPLAHSTLLEC